MPLVSEVLNLGATKGNPPAQEHDFWTSCPNCLRLVGLPEAIVDQADPMETIYRCPAETCGATILIVSTPGVVPWEGRGYRMGDWMVRNPRELFYEARGGAGPVLMPASPHALD